MASGGDEIEAAVNPGVRDALLPGDVDLLLQELLILLIDVFEDGLPAGGNRMFQKRENKSLQMFSTILTLFSQLFKSVATFWLK